MNNNVQVVNQDEIDLIEIILVLWNGKWLVALITLLAIFVGVGYLYVAPSKTSVSINIEPISSFEQEVYADLNALKFYDITQEYLLSLLMEKMSERETLVDAIKSVKFFVPSEFKSQDEYEDAVRKMAYSVQITPPIIDDGLAKNRKTKKREYWGLEIKGYAPEKLLEILKLSIKDSNTQVREALQRRFNQKLTIAERNKKYALEDIERSIKNTKLDYKINITNRLAYLKEQSLIARKLGIDKNTIESQTFRATNSVVTNVKTDSPFYLRGYKAIEKEIGLLESRENTESFMPDLIKLRKKARELTQNPVYERAKIVFMDTPIQDEKGFKAARVDVASAIIKFVISPVIIIALSVILGGTLGVIIILFRHYAHNRQQG